MWWFDGWVIVKYVTFVPVVTEADENTADWSA
jgi:hypothetical protein